MLSMKLTMWKLNIFEPPLIVSLSSLLVPCAFHISELHALMIFGNMLLVLYEYLR